MITIIGLGSLLCQKSAERTCPTLKNFRLGSLFGYRRVFNKTDSDFVKSNEMPVTHNKYACLSAVPCDIEHEMTVSAFEISETEWLPFLKREFEYKLVRVQFIDQDSKNADGILCVGDYKNDLECEFVCESDPYRLSLWKEYKSKCDEPMWRTDLLPDESYLKRCLDIAKEHGTYVYDNFIKTTYIGDQSQTIEEYLRKTNL